MITTPTPIPLLLQECKRRINYSPTAGIFTWKYNRIKSRIGKKLGGGSHNYMAVSLTINKKRNNYLLHRIAFLMSYGYWPKYIDHINGDGKDNRLCNLRECTQEQNNANRGPSKRSSTGLRGVYKSWHSGYISKITYKGVNYHLGMFSCKYEAAKIYDKKMSELFGEFASTNESLGLL